VISPTDNKTESSSDRSQDNGQKCSLMDDNCSGLKTGDGGGEVGRICPTFVLSGMER
jgi:hypothetical protein